MPVESPLFLSYSRKDYSFAESLAFHLLRQGVPVWLDVRDLQPGKDWERGLEEALDTAKAVVLVASSDSMESPNVRNEWPRALRHGKRIVLARFRGAKVPAELQQCESVDFRLHFGRALRTVVACLAPAAPAAGAPKTVGTGSPWIGLPPWVALMAVMLAIPSLAYLLLGDWEPDPSARMPVAVHWALIPMMALLPQECAGREKPEQNLAPGRNWRTLIVFAAYLLVWYVVLGVEMQEAAQP